MEENDDGSDGENWSYMSYKAPVKSSPPTTIFITGQMPFLLPNQQCQNTEGSIWQSHYVLLWETRPNLE